MNESIVLFSYSDPKIDVLMQLFFDEDGSLHFEGQDVGKSVSEYWGDSDYEYLYTIAPAEVQKFYSLFNLKPGDRSGLLSAIKDRFGENRAYSMLGQFMDEHKIKYEAFTWA